MPTQPQTQPIHAVQIAPYGDPILGIGEPATFQNEANLHLVADGYSSRPDFILDCLRLVRELSYIAPFGDLINSGGFAIYTYWEDNPATRQLFIDSVAPASPLDTPLGTYYQTGYNSADGKLYIDYEKFVELGQRLLVWDATPATDLPLLITLDGEPARQYAAGAIVVLMPAAQIGDGATSSYVGLSQEDDLRVEMEHLPTATEPIYFAATTCNEGFERIAARAIALKVGLGDESEQQPHLPTETVGQILNNRPNLIYASTPEAATLIAQTEVKWQPLTSQSTFDVHLRPDSSTTSAVDETSGFLVAPTTPVALWEGGGGYTNGIYRPSQDCLLRRKPGVGVQLFKRSEHPFCPICRNYLVKAFTGEYSTKRAADSVTLATQRSEYDKVVWDKTEDYDAKKLADSFFTVGPNHPAFKYPLYIKADDPAAFWGYTCHFSDQLPAVTSSASAEDINAFYFDQVQVHQSQYYAGLAGDKQKKTSEPQDVRDVFSRLGFHSLKVTFENGTAAVPPPYEFIIAEYIQQKKYKLQRAWGGHLGGDHLYQTAWKLTLIEDRPEWPCLQVELSVVMRGPAPDFDPGGVAEALKCYPQITFKWTRRRGLTLGVKQFEGTVRAVVNTKHYTYDAGLCAPGSGNHFIQGHHMEGTTVIVPANDADSGANDVSCFADSNLSTLYYYFKGSLLKRRDMELPAPFTKPTWAAIFDYYTPHVAQGINGSYDKDFVGAFRHDPTVRVGQVRKMYVHHKVAEPPCQDDGYTPLFITKFPRQGGYDNIHVNGYMGKHDAFAAKKYAALCEADAIAGEDVVAAPFCGIDCFHMHWRWSILSDTVANLTSFFSTEVVSAFEDGTHGYTPLGVVWDNAPSFKGWNTERSHSRLGAPLIPPNQHLDIHLEALDHNKPRLDKIVDYQVTVNAPAPDEKQVILEQGMGWAMIESNLLAAKAGPLAILFAPPTPHGLGKKEDLELEIDDTEPRIIKRIKDPEVAFDKVYDYIRFHHEFIYTSQPSTLGDLLTPLPYADKMKIFDYAQVPDGVTKPTLTWPSSLDPTLALYRKVGDTLNHTLYPPGEQVLIEGSFYDKFNIEDV